jgi:hypothetical protein
VIVATRQKHNHPFFMHFYNLKQTKNKRKKESSLDLLVQICQTSLESKKERKKKNAKPKEFYF